MSSPQHGIVGEWQSLYNEFLNAERSVETVPQAIAPGSSWHGAPPPEPSMTDLAMSSGRPQTHYPPPSWPLAPLPGDLFEAVADECLTEDAVAVEEELLRRLKARIPSPTSRNSPQPQTRSQAQQPRPSAPPPGVLIGSRLPQGATAGARPSSATYTAPPRPASAQLPASSVGVLPADQNRCTVQIGIAAGAAAFVSHQEAWPAEHHSDTAARASMPTTSAPAHDPLGCAASPQSRPRSHTEATGAQDRHHPAGSSSSLVRSSAPATDLAAHAATYPFSRSNFAVQRSPVPAFGSPEAVRMQTTAATTAYRQPPEPVSALRHAFNMRTSPGRVSAPSPPRAGTPRDSSPPPVSGPRASVCRPSPGSPSYAALHNQRQSSPSRMLPPAPRDELFDALHRGLSPNRLRLLLQAVGSAASAEAPAGGGRATSPSRFSVGVVPTGGRPREHLRHPQRNSAAAAVPTAAPTAGGQRNRQLHQQIPLQQLQQQERHGTSERTSYPAMHPYLKSHLDSDSATAGTAAAFASPASSSNQRPYRRGDDDHLTLRGWHEEAAARGSARGSGAGVRASAPAAAAATGAVAAPVAPPGGVNGKAPDSPWPGKERRRNTTMVPMNRTRTPGRATMATAAAVPAVAGEGEGGGGEPVMADQPRRGSATRPQEPAVRRPSVPVLHATASPGSRPSPDLFISPQAYREYAARGGGSGGGSGVGPREQEPRQQQLSPAGGQGNFDLHGVRHVQQRLAADLEAAGRRTAAVVDAPPPPSPLQPQRPVEMHDDSCRAPPYDLPPDAKVTAAVVAPPQPPRQTSRAASPVPPSAEGSVRDGCGGAATRDSFSQILDPPKFELLEDTDTEFEYYEGVTGTRGGAAATMAPLEWHANPLAYGLGPSGVSSSGGGSAAARTTWHVSSPREPPPSEPSLLSFISARQAADAADGSAPAGGAAASGAAIRRLHEPPLSGSCAWPDPAAPPPYGNGHMEIPRRSVQRQWEELGMGPYDEAAAAAAAAVTAAANGQLGSGDGGGGAAAAMALSAAAAAVVANAMNSAALHSGPTGSLISNGKGAGRLELRGAALAQLGSERAGSGALLDVASITEQLSRLGVGSLELIRGYATGYIDGRVQALPQQGQIRSQVVKAAVLRLVDEVLSAKRDQARDMAAPPPTLNAVPSAAAPPPPGSGGGADAAAGAAEPGGSAAAAAAAARIRSGRVASLAQFHEELLARIQQVAASEEEPPTPQPLRPGPLEEDRSPAVQVLPRAASPPLPQPYMPYATSGPHGGAAKRASDSGSAADATTASPGVLVTGRRRRSRKRVSWQGDVGSFAANHGEDADEEYGSSSGGGAAAAALQPTAGGPRPEAAPQSPQRPPPSTLHDGPNRSNGSSQRAGAAPAVLSPVAAAALPRTATGSTLGPASQHGTLTAQEELHPAPGPAGSTAAPAAAGTGRTASLGTSAASGCSASARVAPLAGSGGQGPSPDKQQAPALQRPSPPPSASDGGPSGPLSALLDELSAAGMVTASPAGGACPGHVTNAAAPSTDACYGYSVASHALPEGAPPGFADRDWIDGGDHGRRVSEAAGTAITLRSCGGSSRSLGGAGGSQAASRRSSLVQIIAAQLSEELLDAGGGSPARPKPQPVPAPVAAPDSAMDPGRQDLTPEQIQIQQLQMQIEQLQRQTMWVERQQQLLQVLQPKWQEEPQQQQAGVGLALPPQGRSGALLVDTASSDADSAVSCHGLSAAAAEHAAASSRAGLLLPAGAIPNPAAADLDAAGLSGAFHTAVGVLDDAARWGGDPAHCPGGDEEANSEEGEGEDGNQLESSGSLLAYRSSAFAAAAAMPMAAAAAGVPELRWNPSAGRPRSPPSAASPLPSTIASRASIPTVRRNPSSGALRSPSFGGDAVAAASPAAAVVGSPQRPRASPGIVLSKPAFAAGFSSPPQSPASNRPAKLLALSSSPRGSAKSRAPYGAVGVAASSKDRDRSSPLAYTPASGRAASPSVSHSPPRAGGLPKSPPSKDSSPLRPPPPPPPPPPPLPPSAALESPLQTESMCFLQQLQAAMLGAGGVATDIAATAVVSPQQQGQSPVARAASAEGLQAAGGGVSSHRAPAEGKTGGGTPSADQLLRELRAASLDELAAAVVGLLSSGSEGAGGVGGGGIGMIGKADGAPRQSRPEESAAHENNRRDIVASSSVSSLQVAESVALVPSTSLAASMPADDRAAAAASAEAAVTAVGAVAAAVGSGPTSASNGTAVAASVAAAAAAGGSGTYSRPISPASASTDTIPSPGSCRASRSEAEQLPEPAFVTASTAMPTHSAGSVHLPQSQSASAAAAVAAADVAPELRLLQGQSPVQASPLLLASPAASESSPRRMNSGDSSANSGTSMRRLLDPKCSGSATPPRGVAMAYLRRPRSSSAAVVAQTATAAGGPPPPSQGSCSIAGCGVSDADASGPESCRGLDWGRGLDSGRSPDLGRAPSVSSVTASAPEQLPDSGGGKAETVASAAAGAVALAAVASEPPMEEVGCAASADSAGASAPVTDAVTGWEASDAAAVQLAAEERVTAVAAVADAGLDPSPVIAAWPAPVIAMPPSDAAAAPEPGSSSSVSAGAGNSSSGAFMSPLRGENDAADAAVAGELRPGSEAAAAAASLTSPAAATPGETPAGSGANTPSRGRGRETRSIEPVLTELRAVRAAMAAAGDPHGSRAVRMTELLDQLDGYRRGVERRHGPSHGVASQLRILHADMMKWLRAYSSSGANGAAAEAATAVAKPPEAAAAGGAAAAAVQAPATEAAAGIAAEGCSNGAAPQAQRPAGAPAPSSPPHSANERPAPPLLLPSHQHRAIGRDSMSSVHTDATFELVVTSAGATPRDSGQALNADCFAFQSKQQASARQQQQQQQQEGRGLEPPGAAAASGAHASPPTGDVAAAGGPQPVAGAGASAITAGASSSPIGARVTGVPPAFASSNVVAPPGGMAAATVLPKAPASPAAATASAGGAPAAMSLLELANQLNARAVQQLQASAGGLSEGGAAGSRAAAAAASAAFLPGARGSMGASAMAATVAAPGFATGPWSNSGGLGAASQQQQLRHQPSAGGGAATSPAAMAEAASPTSASKADSAKSKPKMKSKWGLLFSSKK